MPQKSRKRNSSSSSSTVDVIKEFHLDFLHPSQELSWRAYQEHDILFLLGPAGTGKSHLATGFAIHDLLQKKKSKVVITRPVVESGESLGYLPGDFNEKILPYMLPIFDCITKIAGNEGVNREKVRSALEVAPLAYMRGRTFNDAVFILDEAQNCTFDQLKLAITRLGFDSKMIITGDPEQSDLPTRDVALEDVVGRIGEVKGVGVIRFTEADIVRHPLISRILKKLR